eukprot:9638126-Alexandrium_andersonii.AAC.1
MHGAGVTPREDTGRYDGGGLRGRPRGAARRSAGGRPGAMGAGPNWSQRATRCWQNHAATA